MAIFRSFNDIVVLLIESLQLSQPELDTKPGTVARDVFVDAQAQQLANQYSELRNISNLQSFFSTSGTDLNKLASNFGVSRVLGSSSTGVAVLTTNNLDIDIFIAQNEIVTARNGITYRVVNNAVMRSDSANVHRATATRLRSDLDLAGITDEFATEINVEAQTSGVSGNIGRFSLISHNFSGISSVTNLQTFSGGTDAESDDAFRSRILSVFAGNNTGTELGYTTAVEVVADVQDSIVVVPGDPLLIRDGTQTGTDSDGNLIVSEPGTGGKVDIYILGSQVESQVDSFIYNDLGGNADATDPLNDFILGQGGADTTINASQRRIALRDNLPIQPVDSLISVSGSSSGANFVEKFTDSQGRIKGNFELSKDTGDLGGSPFGFDKLKWTSNQIELSDDEITKGTFNGVDALGFSDINRVRNISQDFLVTNENSTTSTTNRSSVTLRHTPVVSVSRIINATTGERYVVESQNPDGTAGELNTTGRITISGNTLPVGTDTLQVDYIWEKPFDNVFDFDNLEITNPNRQAQDSTDWGFGNQVTREPATVADDGYGALIVTVTHPIFKVISVDTFDSDVSTVSNGSLTVNETATSIIDIRRVSDNAELFNTDSASGTLSGTNAIVLPTDTLAVDNDIVNVRFNAADIFSPDGYDQGTTDANVITLPDGVTVAGTSVLITYVASISTLLPEQNIDDLSAVKVNNNFTVLTNTVGDQPTSNLFDSGGDISTNLRRAASHIRIDVGSSVSEGSITVSGVTRKKVIDALVTVTSGTGFKVDLISAVRSSLGVTTLPSTVHVTTLTSLERVIVNSSGLITSIDNVYDIVNYSLNDNSFDLEIALENTSLTKTEVGVPRTTDNIAAQLNTGDIVRVTFYYIDTNDSELLFFSRNGPQISDKLFQDISKISLGAGFKSPTGVVTGKLTVSNFNQPIGNTSYEVDYDYVAPKENERVTVTFNHNPVINAASTAIESVRPITADVLIKAATPKDIDVDIKIVLLPLSVDQEQTIIQDSIDVVNSFLNANSLGTIIDASDVVNILYTVSGIDRVRMINFSTGASGNVVSITAAKNEHLRAGTITIATEDR